MFIFAFIAVLVVILTYLRLQRQRRRAGVRGWMVDQDLDGRGSKVYRDAKLGLSCKPDVVERNRTIEHKSAVVQGRARQGDVLTVAAQMLVTGKEAAELRYPNKDFTFQRSSREMQKAMHKVQSIMGQMRRALTLRISPKGTPTRNKCAKCDFRSGCPDAM